MITSHDSQMNAIGWKNKNRERQNIYWLHHRIKEELGNKQYKLLIKEGKIITLEKEITKGKTIYQLLTGL